MPYYPVRISEHFLSPQNVGDVGGADASAEAGSFICGAVVRLSLKLDAETRVISEARFKAAGCGYLVACASVVTEIIRGLTTAEAAAASALLQETLREYFGTVPREREHCQLLCAEALREALARYSQRVRDEWTGEEALICTCFGISEKRIEQLITDRSLHTVREVTLACNAGGGCQSCRPLIEEMLEEHWRETEDRF
ncbi:MAG TPA: iron-sulfur cluster assembly scaffold protein [Pyrinomonadaceae bacterium]|nr:iron-sulfur cluster assembly scaffold protein [Pyrinomonadaceae bacterium]